VRECCKNDFVTLTVFYANWIERRSQRMLTIEFYHWKTSLGSLERFDFSILTTTFLHFRYFIEFRTNRSAKFLLAQSNLRQNERTFRQISSSRLIKLHFLSIPMTFFYDKILSSTSFEIFFCSILNWCLLASQSSCSIHALTRYVILTWRINIT